MSDVQFSEEQQYATPPPVVRQGGLIQLVQKWGLAKDEKGAQQVLLIIVGVAVLIAVVSIVLGGSSESSVPRSVIESGLPPEARSR